MQLRLVVLDEQAGLGQCQRLGPPADGQELTRPGRQLARLALDVGGGGLRLDHLGDEVGRRVQEEFRGVLGRESRLLRLSQPGLASAEREADRHPSILATALLAIFAHQIQRQLPGGADGGLRDQVLPGEGPRLVQLDDEDSGAFQQGTLDELGVGAFQVVVIRG